MTTSMSSLKSWMSKNGHADGMLRWIENKSEVMMKSRGCEEIGHRLKKKIKKCFQLR